MTSKPQKAIHTQVNTSTGDVGITANVPAGTVGLNGRDTVTSPVRGLYRGVHNPRPVTASFLISRTAPWVGVSERTVQKSVNLVAERTRAAVQVYRSLGDARASHLIGIVTSGLEDADADSPPIAEVLFDAQRADLLEEMPDAELLQALGTGKATLIVPATIAVAKRCLRLTEAEMVAQARKARKLRQWIAEHEGEQ